MSEPEKYQFDALDLALMQSLQKDGREPFSELSKRLGIVVSTVSKRYQKLVEDGVLKIIGRVDPNKVGYNAYACILIRIDRLVEISEIAQQLSALPEVSFLAMRTGEFDLELNVMCRDNNHLLDLMQRLLKVQGIQKTETHMYLKVYKWGQPEITI
ncbi:MAG: Lrp/AsnC family transcriptional regulator [Cytophagia bacterium]|nr:MAG: Lrp/AsnC family transcriptional regulator [Runella slithyformis]TAG18788.1 MAG: Lrp/AsnC family transcriptional regulator [Cytophagales bacterium]TAG40392.1 MAG: Lrp/AsnC family transcriptional regulator [Cytophagia bacterium]TAG74708.1 MAG: Lrp/AsnC family transcriptional regulator [Runella slithyformis]TAG79708.1 MAG: Lrp/AsnC family transcriptional regulator [Cytophagales bacterium]